MLKSSVFHFLPFRFAKVLIIPSDGYRWPRHLNHCSVGTPLEDSRIQTESLECFMLCFWKSFSKIDSADQNLSNVASD